MEWNLLQIPYSIIESGLALKEYKRKKIEKSLKIEDKIEETCKKYYDHVIALSAHKVISESLKLCNRSLEINKKYFRSGKISRSELLESQIECNKLKSQLLDQSGLIDSTKIELNNTMNKEKEFDYKPDLEIDIDKNLKWDKIFSDFSSISTRFSNYWFS